MPIPFASGRDADVFALDNDRVLRRYRAGGDVRREAELMRYAAEHGYPVPTVHTASGPDLVLQRLHGPTMLEAARPGDGRLLADLHHRLHQLPAPSGTPGATVVHGDLHPANVILTQDGPMVIDWRNATEGPAGLDVAMTAVILAQASLGPAAGPQADLARRFLTEFLPAVPDPTPMLPEAITRRSTDPNLTPTELTHLHQVPTLLTPPP